MLVLVVLLADKLDISMLHILPLESSAGSTSSSELERQVHLRHRLPAGRCGASSASPAHAHAHQWRHPRGVRSRGRSRVTPELPAAGVEPAGGRGRGSSRGGDGNFGGDVAAALGEGALQLVRVLVAAERLRAQELAVAVVAGEGLPAGVFEGRGSSRGRGCRTPCAALPLLALGRGRGRFEAQVEADALQQQLVRLRRLALHLHGRSMAG
uniref:Uncharacterized protein n=1 Tax=Triticum urartu TaxID=4572 RepID=A0A8R7UJP0_TRIUA